MKVMNQAKEVVAKYTRPALNTIIVAAIATVAFKAGVMYGNRPQKQAEENPYAHAFAPDEISIAVNESNELIVIERATGDYIVYSDQIGQTIFGMYANRIHQEVANGK